MSIGPILVTGTSTGIGRAIIELLIEKNCHVYAGARKKEDLEELNKLPNVTPIKIDVTKTEDIKAVVRKIQNEKRGLYGLVNNAGIVTFGPVFTHNETTVHDTFNVNVFGPYHLTNAMLPLLIESKGRIINMSSIAGIGVFSNLGLYCMSKYAIEAYSDALRINLKNFGIKVSVIEPGTFKSRARDTGISSYKENEQIRMKQYYSKERIIQITESLENWINDVNLNSPEPYPVAEAVYDGLFSENPKLRYLVGSYEEEVEAGIRNIINLLVQLNQDHKHSFTRSKLIEILDETLKNA